MVAGINSQLTNPYLGMLFGTNPAYPPTFINFKKRFYVWRNMIGYVMFCQKVGWH